MSHKGEQVCEYALYDLHPLHTILLDIHTGVLPQLWKLLRVNSHVTSRSEASSFREHLLTD